MILQWGVHPEQQECTVQMTAPGLTCQPLVALLAEAEMDLSLWQHGRVPLSHNVWWKGSVFQPEHGKAPSCRRVGPMFMLSFPSLSCRALGLQNKAFVGLIIFQGKKESATPWKVVLILESPSFRYPSFRPIWWHRFIPKTQFCRYLSLPE